MAKKRLQKKRAAAAEKKQAVVPKIESKKDNTRLLSAASEEDSVYARRFQAHKDELKNLYCELYQDNSCVMMHFDELVGKMKEFYDTRSVCLKTSDKKREADPDWYKRGDLLGMMMYSDNFAKNLKGVEEKLDYIQECNVTYLHLMPEGNLRGLSHLAEKCHERGISLCVDFAMSEASDASVLNEMLCSMLSLVNQGVDLVRLDTDSCMLPQIHTLIRLLRIVSEIVCPGVLLSCKVNSNTETAVSYFGTTEQPECHILCNAASEAAIWHTVATRDVSLLRKSLDTLASLPEGCVFQNYLRCNDEISWELDYDYLKNFAIEETPHKNYLNDFLSGRYPDSFARGELYNETPNPENAKLCGTTASFCGIERFGFEGNEDGVARGIRYDITLHAFLLSQSGIPVICSGDEIGQLNDYSYKNDEKKAADCRHLHKGEFNWSLADNRRFAHTVQGRLFPVLNQMERIRAAHSVFDSSAAIRTLDTWDSSVLALVRENEEEKFIGLYNFNEFDKTAWINEKDGRYVDLISGHEMEANAVQIPAFGCFWLCRKK